MLLPSSPLLAVRNLKQHYPVLRGMIVKERIGVVRAVDDVSFDIAPGQTLAVAGEHKAGKSALARTVAVLDRPTGGSVEFEGQDLTRLRAGRLRQMRRRLQFVFSDPRTALNPAATVGEIVTEPLAVHNIGRGEERRTRATAVLQLVGLNAYLLDRRITSLSVGSRQRVAVARALALDPSLVICDDPTAALEPAAAAGLLAVLEEVKRACRLTYLWTTSRPQWVRRFADWLIVLYRGRAVEAGAPATVLDEPLHPYTRAYLGRPATEELPGGGPFVRGCRYHPDCPQALDICRKERPAWQEVRPGHWVACYLYA